MLMEPDEEQNKPDKTHTIDRIESNRQISSIDAGGRRFVMSNRLN